VRIESSRRQVDRLLRFAAPWPQRVWAVEGAAGVGRLMAQQLVEALSLPDIPTTAQLLRRRRTGPHPGNHAKGTWSLSVLADGCDPVRQELKDALALAGEQPTPSNT
jgi:hypothetical protein